jgi:hypothetical protein
MTEQLPQDPDAVSAIVWPAQEEFDTWWAAFEWAFFQNKDGGPRYKVQRLRDGRWEAIQAWMANY